MAAAAAAAARVRVTATARQSLLLLLVLLLLSLVVTTHGREVPFPVYLDGRVRRSGGGGAPSGASSLLPSAALGAAASTRPIDFRFPCDDDDASAGGSGGGSGAQPPCFLNVDAARPPARVVDGGDDAADGGELRSCRVPLMAFSPFPCARDDKHPGVPGQPMSLCFTSSGDGGDGAGGARAINLTTDGYNNVFLGRLPDDLALACAAAEDGSSSTTSSSTTSANRPLPGSLTAAERLLVRLEFRVAQGRQFDRTYTLSIGDLVVALGTCTEPSGRADKRWRVEVDITHLQAYVLRGGGGGGGGGDDGRLVRFSLASVLTPVYNVPIWASAELVIVHRGGHGGAAAAPPLPPADAADEVVPLVPAGNPPGEPLATLAGTGDPPAPWPRVTFTLPPGVTSPSSSPSPSSPAAARRDAYRALLVVQPKANGCEEFWAMNPSGAGTNSTCGGRSTGEPWREVRAYVNGGLAGFSPIFYTMYTGGVDPRLWQAVVAMTAYSLPAYTFDLTPWVGALNNGAPSPSDSDSDSDPGSASATPRTTAAATTISVELAGAANADWQVAAALLLWRAGGGEVISSAPADGGPEVLVTPSLLAPVTSACAAGAGAGDPSQAAVCSIDLRRRALTARATLVGAPSGRAWAAEARYDAARYANTITFAYGSSSSSSSGGSDEDFFEWRQRTEFSAAWSLRELPGGAAAARAALRRQEEVRRLAGAAAADEQQQQEEEEAALGARDGADGLVVTQAARAYEWTVNGGVFAGAVYEHSFNETLLAPTVYRRLAGSGSGGDDGSAAASGAAGASAAAAAAAAVVVVTGQQRHYQRAVMTDVYDPQQPTCPGSGGNASHTSRLRSTLTAVAAAGGSGAAWRLQQRPAAAAAAAERCVSWRAACGFCSPQLSELRERRGRRQGGGYDGSSGGDDDSSDGACGGAEDGGEPAAPSSAAPAPS